MVTDRPTEEYECMRDIGAYYSQKGCVHRDLVKLREISVSISETVQDRDIVAMDD